MLNKSMIEKKPNKALDVVAETKYKVRQNTVTITICLENFLISQKHQFSQLYLEINCSKGESMFKSYKHTGQGSRTEITFYGSWW